MPNINCYCRGAGCIYCEAPDENTKALNGEWEKLNRKDLEFTLSYPIIKSSRTHHAALSGLQFPIKPAPFNKVDLAGVQLALYGQGGKSIAMALQLFGRADRIIDEHEVQKAIARAAYELGLYKDAKYSCATETPDAKDIKLELAAALRALGMSWGRVEKTVANFVRSIK